jgi:CTD small phosphatase-like protein 2
MTPFGYVKDLRIIKNREMKNILMIDNSCLSFAFNVNNGVPILPFYDNIMDEELKHLTYYLNRIEDVEDIRPENMKAFGLMKLRENYSSQRSKK